MKENYESIIVPENLDGEDSQTLKCILVPYRPQHVERYHSWMQDAALRAATASDLLTLEEEYAMQESWYRDPKKCTCIILDCSRLRPTSFPSHGPIDEVEKWILAQPDFIQDQLDAMVGDVNLFLSDNDDDDDATGYQQAEINMMVAVTGARQRGCGYAAVRCMMIYGAEHLNICRYYGKIHATNAASIRLFQKLGFRLSNYCECFQEFEYELVAATPEEMLHSISEGRYDDDMDALPPDHSDRKDRSSSSSSLIRVLQCPLPSNRPT